VHDPLFAARFGLLAQVAHVHVQRARRGLEVVPPDLAVDGVAREHQPDVEQQQLAQVELCLGEIEGPVTPPRQARRRVEPHVTDLQHLADPRNAGAPQQRPQPGRQLGHGVGLDQVVVGPGVEPDHAVADLVARRQHQDRQVRVRGPQVPAGRQTVEVRHHHVEDHQIGTGAAGRLERQHPVGHRLHVVALEAQAPDQRLAYASVVLGHQYPSGGGIGHGSEA